MEGFCRACLLKYDEPTDFLQYTERNRRLFVYSTNLQVKRNDAFPFQLCKDCSTNMKMACKFKKLCRTSDKRLRNYLALKDVGDSIDFCTFLKNNDDTLTFRFPLQSGNSTPANHKNDDNESTCTSIRNFMTDILQGEEVPDSEAQIIREVIEEEADVLDDSLDSHWLQDDMSIDTDFGFSPFSTPHTVHNDHCYTPKKLDSNKQPESPPYYSVDLDVKRLDDNETANFETPAKEQDNDENNPYILSNSIEFARKLITDELARDSETIRFQGKKYLNYYTEQLINEPAEITSDYCIETENDAKRCTIDRNLEEALKNEDNQEFALDDLLVTPPAGSEASTPTIQNILFGDKLDIDGENANLPPTPSNQLDEVKTDDIYDDFFAVDPLVVKDEDEKDEYIINEGINEQDIDDVINTDSLFNETFSNQDNNSKDMNHDNIIDKDIINEDVNDEDIAKLLADVNRLVKYDLEKGHCLSCDKTFKNARALRIHLSRLHDVSIPVDRNEYVKQFVHRYRTCEVCGQEMPTYTYYKHKKLHLMPKVTKLQCDHCKITCASKRHMIQHLRSHGFMPAIQYKSKPFMCATCGAVIHGITNYKVHVARHNKKFTIFCQECDKGFYKACDLDNHYRTHTGERPFGCEHCINRFARRADYVRHVKTMHSGGKYACDCGVQFTKKASLTMHKKRSKYCKRIMQKKARDEAKIKNKQI